MQTGTFLHVLVEILVKRYTIIFLEIITFKSSTPKSYFRNLKELLRERNL